MRPVLVLALAACSAPSAARLPEDAGADARSADAAPDAAAAAVEQPAPAPLPAIHSAHAHQISLVAASEDGKLAATADAFGSVRVWPSLDGKHEPAIVRIVRPSTLAVMADGEDVVVGALDGAGTLELARMRKDGVQLARTEVALAGPAADLRATSAGMLVLLADQSFALVASDGKVMRTLAVPPGHHVVGFATRRGAAIALLGSAENVRGRWLALPQLAWGGETAPLTLDPAHVALSPDARRIAGMHGGAAWLIDLATGRKRKLENPLADDGDAVDVIGFATSGALALQIGTRVGWTHDGDIYVGTSVFGPATVADGKVVFGHSLQLGLVTPDDLDAPKYLGYRIDTPRATERTASHLLLAGADRIVVADLLGRQRRTMKIGPPPYRNLVATVPIDEKHALELVNDSSVYAFQVMNVTLDGSVEPQTIGTCNVIVEYVRATQLIACTQRGEAWFARYEPKSGTVSNRVDVKLLPGEDVKLVEPARSGGNVALDVLLEPSPVLVPIRAVYTDGRANPVEYGERRAVSVGYDWFASGQDEQMAKLGVSPGIRRRHGGLVAELRGERLVLRRGKAVVWEIAAPTATDIVWTDSGELVVIGAGVARVDLATGALVDAQCGWAFGLWDEPADGSETTLLCEA